MISFKRWILQTVFKPYSCILEPISKHYCNTVAFLYTNGLQTPCQYITLNVKQFVRQSTILMP